MGGGQRGRSIWTICQTNTAFPSVSELILTREIDLAHKDWGERKEGRGDRTREEEERNGPRLAPLLSMPHPNPSLRIPPLPLFYLPQSGQRAKGRSEA